MIVNKNLLAAAVGLAAVFTLAACGSINTPAPPGGGASVSSSSETGSIASSGSTDKANESAAKAVLFGLFNAPDKKLAAALTNAGNVIGEGVSESAPQENSSAIKDKFGDYFTEKALEQFTADYLSPYQGMAYTDNSALELKDTALTKTNSGYDFSASVQYTKAAEVKTVKAEGNVQFLDNGKITSFCITSDGGLSEILKSGLR